MRHVDMLSSAELAGKTCLIRADYNCPLSDGMLTDTSRIDQSLPGIKAVREQGARLVLTSHLGRPKGQIVEALSLTPVAEYVGHQLGCAVPVVDAEMAAEALETNDVIMLENLRFNPGEEQNDPDFAARLAAIADIYINDAFSCAHRAHASTHAITSLLPSYAGSLLMREVSALKAALENPDRPVAAFVGGAKISTKLDVLRHLVSKVDHLFLGGGMANTFSAANGHHIGASLYEPDMIATAEQVMRLAETSGCRIHLPVDGIVAREFAAGASSEVKMVTDRLNDDQMILDIGPASITAYLEVLGDVKTVLWNGPMGAFELDGFATGTVTLARAVAEMTESGQLSSVAGGGDTVAALNLAGCADSFSYVSLAGGAFLEWIEGKQLPGIAALEG